MACIRNRSRAALSASVSPPPCAYLTYTGLPAHTISRQKNSPDITQSSSVVAANASALICDNGRGLIPFGALPDGLEFSNFYFRRGELFQFGELLDTGRRYLAKHRRPL